MSKSEAQRVNAIYGSIAVKRGPIRSLQCTFLHKGGSTVFVESSAKPFFDSNSKFVGYRGVTKNTDKVHTLES
jgi:hypothetical protein